MESDLAKRKNKIFNKIELSGKCNNVSNSEGQKTVFSFSYVDISLACVCVYLCASVNVTKPKH